MIHYHGADINPAEAAREVWRRSHAMVSFSRPQQDALAFEVAQTVALDNGAYSAWTKGKTPDWNDFANWVKDWCSHPAFDWCVIPDCIDGSEKENRNLVAWWLSLPNRVAKSGVPVWHLHESLDYLSWLVENFPLVALGSSGQFADPGTLGWWQRIAQAMRRCCDQAAGRPLTQLHGLRMLDPTIFSHLPLRSADSVTVGRNIGMDSKWGSGPYRPLTKRMRAAILAERIEMHASAAHWDDATLAVQRNFSLVG